VGPARSTSAAAGRIEFTLVLEHRARIAEAQRRRWAKRRVAHIADHKINRIDELLPSRLPHYSEVDPVGDTSTNEIGPKGCLPKDFFDIILDRTFD
jgi:hypothetical protein